MSSFMCLPAYPNELAIWFAAKRRLLAPAEKSETCQKSLTLKSKAFETVLGDV